MPPAFEIGRPHLRIGEQRRQSENFGFAEGAAAAGVSTREAARLDSFIQALSRTAGAVAVQQKPDFTERSGKAAKDCAAMHRQSLHASPRYWRPRDIKSVHINSKDPCNQA